MTQEEILLFKELIKETVKSVVKEVIKEELASNPIKKDLKEVKLLLAKSIKESRAIMVEKMESTPTYPEYSTKLREAIGGDFESLKRPKAPVMPSMSPEKAMGISMNGTLPDFDAPIPFIDKKSAIWEDLNNKIS